MFYYVSSLYPGKRLVPVVSRVPSVFDCYLVDGDFRDRVSLLLQVSDRIKGKSVFYRLCFWCVTKILTQVYFDF